MFRYALFILIVPALVFAQGTVTIYGTVTDPSGAAIAGAKVTVTNSATGQSRDTISAIDGNYVVPDLRVGAYRLTVTAAGFKTFVQDGIQVQVDENRRVPVQMAVGGVNESITVAADVAQVETRSSALRQVVDSARIVELPLNGRNPLQLSYLVAGSSGSTDPAGGQSLNTSVSIDGMRANSNNYSLDGADNQDPFFLNSTSPLLDQLNGIARRGRYGLPCDMHTMRPMLRPIADQACRAADAENSVSSISPLSLWERARVRGCNCRLNLNGVAPRRHVNQCTPSQKCRHRHRSTRTS